MHERYDDNHIDGIIQNRKHVLYDCIDVNTYESTVRYEVYCTGSARYFTTVR